MHRFVLFSLAVVMLVSPFSASGSPDADRSGVLPVKSVETMTVELPALPEGARKLEMVLISPGTFTMGSPEDERGRSDKEWLPHTVTISQPFYLGKYEVTQAQWKAVMGSMPKSKAMVIGPNHPVGKVSWNGCQKFIKRLDALAQGTFRLPTEAEWEYACRAGTTTQYSFGDTLEHADQYMWWSGNNDPNGAKEVGLKLPNPWGLFDMDGNVSEWCSDRWEAPHEREPQTDPKGPSGWFHTWLTNHVNRGGSFFLGAQACRAASRHYEQSIDYHYTLGLRLVMTRP
jgi:formylglycine-generating enzyme required for sulfatase activity